MSTNINSTEQIVEINAGDQITNVNIVSQSTTQVISGEQVVTIDTNAGTIPAAWGSITGTLSNQTDLQNALNLKQNQISLTTQGTSGAATFIGSVLNIPNYTDTGLTSVGVSMPTGFDVSGSPLTSNGTINVNFANGYGLPTTAKQGEWDQAYNDKINSAEVSGTTTKTLILNQQDGGTITASWSDIDTGLTSVGLEMPSAFTVSGSPLTSNGTITVTGSGTTSQYVRGDGSLANFPSVSNEAKTLIREVYNKTGATLTKGTVIYIDGGQGNLPTVTKAIATGDPTSAQTFGIVQSDITNMNNGFVVVAGGIDNLDTQAYTEGTALYLSPTTAGAWTSTKPYAPDHMVYLGVVVRSHPTQGVIEVKIQNGVELDEIHDVSARFPTNKDGLFYNSTSGVWENKSIAGVLGYTPVPESRIITINGTAQDLSADRTYNVGTVTSVAASGGTGISVAGSPVTGSGTITITNTAPDQVVGLTGAGTTSISGTYPNFTITSNDQYTGTVTSVAASGGTGISISGSPITSSGTINITNTAPDQIVSLTGTGTTNITGTYPSFTINSADQYTGTVTSVAASGGTGIQILGSPVTGSGTISIVNTAPDKTVSLTGAGTTSISGTYPSFTITSNDQYNGTVTNVAVSGGNGITISGSPVTGSGTITVTNSAPDKTVTITGGGTTVVSGTYPNFNITSNDAYVGTVTSVSATVPTGFSVSGVPITTSGNVDISFSSGYSLPTNAKQTQWDDAYAKRINSLTVTGNSGSATLTSNVLNVPTYTLGGLGGEPAITAGTTLQYFRGDKTFQTLNTAAVPESGNIYFTEPRVRATVLSGLNITGGSISASDNVLNAFGKLQNQINGLIGGSIFQSTWNASTNTPSLASGVGTKGYYYIVSVAGTTNLDGITDWQIGDWAIFDGTVWRKVDNTDAVVSVNGYTGIVNLVLDDLYDVSAASPTNAQLLRFNGTSSKWENWTPNYLTTITLTGDVTGTGTSSIATTIGAGKVTNAMLAGSIAASKLVGTDIATVGTITTGIWNGTTIAIANGGTGATTKAAAFNALSPMTTLGDIIYGGASGAGTRLAGNTAASKRFLIQTGDGTNSAAPSWGTIAAGDVPTLNYLPLSGGTLTGILNLKADQYYEQATPAWSMDAKNGDIIGLNALYFNDLTDSNSEGINWYNSATTWDSLYSKSGVLYYNPNRTSQQAGTEYKIWTAGNDGTGSGLDADLLDGQHGSYYAPALSGTTGTIAYWSSPSSITGSATFTYTPTSALLVNNSVTAASAIARGVNITSTLVAAANNDVLVGLDINPTFTNGAFTGVSNIALRVTGNATVTGTITGTLSGNAATATKLETARTLTIGATGKTFDGSTDRTWTLAEIGAAAALSGTINTIAYWNSATTIASLATATYPSLTELSYVKGVTSAIQTQLDAKAADNAVVKLTGNQTIDGNKTFSAQTYFNADIHIKTGQSVRLYNVADTFSIGLKTVTTVTANRTISFPDATGTVALTSDLSSYLPLSGGTLTGALSGTSATFAAAKTNVGSYNDGILYIRDTTTLAANNGGSIVFDGKYNAAGAYATGASISAYKVNATDGNTAYGLTFGTRSNGGAVATRLTISDTGAATFSSSVTAATALITNPNSGDYLTITNTDPSIGGGEAIGLVLDYTQAASATGWKILSRYAGGNLQFVPNYQNAGYNTPALSLNYNGAATFSSSVTAETSAGKIMITPTGWRDPDRATILLRTKTDNPAEIDLQNTISGANYGWQISSRESTTPTLYFFSNINGSFTPRLYITSTGAATFSSSVTATNATFSQTTTNEQTVEIKNTGVGDAGINIYAGTGKRVLQRYYVSNNPKWGLFVNDPAVGTDSFGIYNYTNANFAFSMLSTGAATFSSSVTATSFFESSDIRLKSNIQDYKSSDILNISAKIYEKDGKVEVGYLAQDLESVLKSAVSIRENGYLDLSYRQVHTAKIAALEAKIKELEAKIK